MTEAPEQPTPTNGRSRQSAAVVTAVVVILGICASVVGGWYLGRIETTEVVALLGPVLGAATTWLWVSKSQERAAVAALTQPGTGTGGIETNG